MLSLSKTHKQEVADAAHRLQVEAEARGEVIPPEDRRVGLVAAYRQARNDE